MTTSNPALSDIIQQRNKAEGRLLSDYCQAHQLDYDEDQWTPAQRAEFTAICDEHIATWNARIAEVKARTQPSTS